MYRYLVCLFLTAIAMSGCSSDLGENEFIVSGSVDGMENGEFYVYAEGGYDTITVNNGMFEYRGVLTGPENRFFNMDPNDRSMDGGFSLFLEPGKMELSINAERPFSPKLKGSKTQDEFELLGEKKEVVKQKYQAELKALTDASNKYRQAYRAKASEETLEAIKEEDNTARENLEPYYKELRAIDIAFIRSNPNSYVGLYNARFFLDQLIYAEAADLFESFADHLKESKMGVEIANELAKLKSGSPGSLASDITAQDINGEQFSLSDLRGQYVLIDFWASWCVPCRKGNPHLLDLYAKYKEKGFEILGVSDDDSRPEAWRKAVKKDGIGVWKHVLRGLERKDGRFVFDNDVSDAYGISTLPTKILIDPEGMIIGRYGSGGSEHPELDEKLKEIFGS